MLDTKWKNNNSKKLSSNEELILNADNGYENKWTCGE